MHKCGHASLWCYEMILKLLFYMYISIYIFSTTFCLFSLLKEKGEVYAVQRKLIDHTWGGLTDIKEQLLKPFSWTLLIIDLILKMLKLLLFGHRWFGLFEVHCVMLIWQPVHLHFQTPFKAYRCYLLAFSPIQPIFVATLQWSCGQISTEARIHQVVCKLCPFFLFQWPPCFFLSFIPSTADITESQIENSTAKLLFETKHGVKNIAQLQ